MWYRLLIFTLGILLSGCQRSSQSSSFHSSSATVAAQQAAATPFPVTSPSVDSIVAVNGIDSSSPFPPSSVVPSSALTAGGNGSIVTSPSVDSIVAVNGADSSSPFPPSSIAPSPALTAGGNGSITVTGKSFTSLTLTWTPPAQTNATGGALLYQIYQTTTAFPVSPSSEERPDASTMVKSFADLYTDTTYTATNLHENTEYFFVIAVQDPTTEQIAWYVAMSASTLVDNAPLPGGAGSLVVNQITDASASLIWTTVTDTDTSIGGLQYAIYLQPHISAATPASLNSLSGVDDSGIQPIPVEKNLGQYSFSGLQNGTTYTVNVLVTDSYGKRSLYNATSFTTQDMIPPSIPILTASAFTTTAVTLSWAASTNVAMDTTQPYALYASTTPVLSLKTMTDVTSAITANTLTPLTLTTPTSASILLGASPSFAIFVVVAKSLTGIQSFGFASVFLPQTGTTTSSFIINAYATVSDPNPTGTQLTVDTTTGFKVGDEILVLQTQAQPNTGVITLNREFATIQSLTSTAITLSAPLVNAYTSGTSTTAQSKVTQVVSVPHVANFFLAAGQTLTAMPWDGTKGGVVLFRDNGTTTISGSIDVTGQGFRGGSGTPPGGSTSGAALVAGTGEAQSGLGSGGGGASIIGTCSNCSGLGGGYATPGSRTVCPKYTNCQSSSCSINTVVGPAFGAPALASLSLGSGGGGAAHNCGCTYIPSGSAGGGIVMVFSRNLQVISGTIKADGGLATAHSCGLSGGSGSGGSIYLSATQMNVGVPPVASSRTLSFPYITSGTSLVTTTTTTTTTSIATYNVSARGGLLFTDMKGYGGAGVDGRIRLDVKTLTINATNTQTMTGTDTQTVTTTVTSPAPYVTGAVAL